MNEKILIVEDEDSLRNLAADYLSKVGFAVVTATTGPQALRQFDLNAPDLVLLDIQLPELDGWEVARRLLERSAVPIIFLTARKEETDRVTGLDLGADDYLTKPYSPRELAARIRAVLRRTGKPADSTASPAGLLCHGGLGLDVSRHLVTVEGRPVSLTALQFELLHRFLLSPGVVFSRERILKEVLGTSFPGYERTIDAHIKNLRKALGDDADHPRYLETIRGVGYRLKESP